MGWAFDDMNRVAVPWCHAQTPSRNMIIYFWVGLIRACMIWSVIVCLRIVRTTLSESSCLPPSSTESNLH